MMGFDLRHIAKDKTSTTVFAPLTQTGFNFKDFFSRILLTNKRKAVFYSELSVFLKAHIPLKEALESIAASQQNSELKALFEQMATQLKRGKRFFEILKEDANVSAYDWVAVKIGEETGHIATIITALSSHYQRRYEHRNKFTMALLYPMMIVFTSLLVLLFMLYAVVPMFEDIFIQNKVTLPPLTQFILALSSFVKTYGLLMFFIVVLSIILLRFFRNNDYYRRLKENFILQIPGLGSFIKMSYMTQFLNALALLISARIPLLNALKLTREMIRFIPLENAIYRVEQSVLEGESLYKAMQATAFFDHGMISFVKVGEAAHQLDTIFEQLFQQYQDKIFLKSKKLTTLMEPVLILIVGVLVAVILIAMYLPMFKLSTILE